MPQKHALIISHLSFNTHAHLWLFLACSWLMLCQWIMWFVIVRKSHSWAFLLYSYCSTMCITSFHKSIILTLNMQNYIVQFEAIHSDDDNSDGYDCSGTCWSSTLRVDSAQLHCSSPQAEPFLSFTASLAVYCPWWNACSSSTCEGCLLPSPASVPAP